jgi:hypothetical protein
LQLPLYARLLLKMLEGTKYGDIKLFGCVVVLLKDDGTYVWRDLLSIGFNDGEIKTLDYPFLNGSHYSYQNYCFNLKRQDPYAQWGLLYTNFPSDATGDRITDRFTVKSSDDVC